MLLLQSAHCASDNPTSGNAPLSKSECESRAISLLEKCDARKVAGVVDALNQQCCTLAGQSWLLAADSRGIT
jgi:hypothetical protein